ncbi:MAG: lysophospholipase [Deltaproteobacteria bacterium]|nr:lysophospholipase [Deltaproteobacteria bacterium]
MNNKPTIDYSPLDQPAVLMYLFHPRPEPDFSPLEAPESAASDVLEKNILIPVDKGVAIGARFHMANKSGVNIIFFHGNGEIVADYDELGFTFNQMDINFLAVDYRGYGRSTGKPTVSAMMGDCHLILEFIQKWLEQNGFSGPIILMGRSLGSAPVLELTAANKDLIEGLIVESGFAYAGPLLKLLGIDPEALGFKEEQGFRNIDKIEKFKKPTLIIHAEFDHIIPFSDGRALYAACPSADKRLLKISGANHNDIFMHGLREYLAAVKRIVETVGNARL